MTCCAVLGCKSNSDKRLKRNQTENVRLPVRFYKFPSDAALRKVWLQKCGKDENLRTKFLYVCAKHFVRDHFVRNLQHELLNYTPRTHNQLKKDAIPTEYLPVQSNSSVSIPESPIIIKNEPILFDKNNTINSLPAKLDGTNDLKLSVTKSEPKQLETPKHTTLACISNPELQVNEKRSEAEISETSKLTSVVIVWNPEGQPNVQRNEPDKSEKPKHSLVSAIYDLEKQLDAAKKEIEELVTEIKVFKKDNHFYKEELKWIDKLFTPNQRRKMRFGNRRVNWDAADISQAISIHASGSKAYKLLLTRNYPFPAVTTLRRWVSKLNVDPEYLDVVLGLMKNANFSSFQKVCILMADEMKIRKAYEYDGKKDTLVAPVSSVQVIMARGLFENWQQPVYYSYDTILTKMIFKNLISKLNAMDYNVVAIVLDLGRSNHGLWSKLEVTECNPFILHPDNELKKVYVMNDTLNLIKLFRNHFLDSGVMLDGKLLTKEPLEELLAKQAELDMKVPSQLSATHLAVNLDQRQNVKFATQIFSDTNACALKQMHTLKLAKSDYCLELSILLKQVNDWFDVFNSRITKVDPRLKQAAYGLALEQQDRILSDMLKTVKRMRVANHKSLIPFQKGIVNNISALKMLFVDMQQQYGIKYIQTCRFNRDPLDLFFSVMRANGGLNDYPTALQFKYRLRTFLFGQNKSQSTNTEQDKCNDFPKAENQSPMEVAADDSTFFAGGYVPTITSFLLTNLGGPESSTDDDSDEMIGLEYDALDYLAEYILQRLGTRKPYILQTYCQEGSKSLYTWNDKETKGVLPRPSDQFLEKLKELEDIFNDYNLPTLTSGPDYIKNLLDLAEAVDLEIEIKQLYFRCKMYFNIKILNKSLPVNDNVRKTKINKTEN